MRSTTRQRSERSCCLAGDGFIDLGELRAALAKAGNPVSEDEAEQMLRRVDTNNDGQISLQEFREVFSLSPSAVPEPLRKLFEARPSPPSSARQGAPHLGRRERCGEGSTHRRADRRNRTTTRAESAPSSQ